MAAFTHAVLGAFKRTTWMICPERGSLTECHGECHLSVRNSGRKGRKARKNDTQEIKKPCKSDIYKATLCPEQEYLAPRSLFLVLPRGSYSKPLHRLRRRRTFSFVRFCEQAHTATKQKSPPNFVGKALCPEQESNLHTLASTRF
jgi:hypothetical protein